MVGWVSLPPKNKVKFDLLNYGLFWGGLMDGGVVDALTSRTLLNNDTVRLRAPSASGRGRANKQVKVSFRHNSDSPWMRREVQP